METVREPQNHSRALFHAQLALMIQKKKKKISLFGRERMAGEAKKHGCNQRSIRVCVRAAGAAVWTSHSPRRGDYSRIDLLQHTPAHRQEESPYRIIPRVGPLHQLAERCAHPAPDECGPPHKHTGVNRCLCLESTRMHHTLAWTCK